MEHLQVTVPQAAKLLGIRRETAWRMARAGKFGRLHGQTETRRGTGYWLKVEAAALVARFDVDPEAIRKLTEGK